MNTLINVGILFALDIGTRLFICFRRALRFGAPILILGACLFAGTAARAQGMGYMRVMTAHGQVAGESTDPAHDGWIPLRDSKMPSAAQIAAMAEEAAAAPDAASGKATHPPVVIVKDRDNSSLVLLAAYSNHQHFPEIDIVVTKYGDQPTARYKLTDATVVSLRASGTEGTQEPVEQLRIAYAKIEIQQ
jgi:type VI secretion system Hcp family effector